jgi:spore maturation protein CgeB
MRILFVGVFDINRRSTNTSQILAFKKSGHNITGYNYRKRASALGNELRDKELINLVKERKFDLVVYSKCNVVSKHVFVENSKHSKICLWFMDPLVSYNQEMREKTCLVDYFCCDKLNVLDQATQYNNNSFHVCEGYDEEVDRPAQTDKEYNISFIGNLYGPRKQTLSQINHEVKIINNAFGHKHSEEVSRTKINLNFCTDGGASDRVYKVLAAGGFLISNDWAGRSDMFEENKDLVIFTDIKDLNDKINYYLNNTGKREEIAKQGNRTVQKYNRFSWAQQIINIHERLYR